MVMGRFIYVFSSEARDKLIQLGYALLKHDKRNNIFIFENNPELKFTSKNIEFALSDTLTF